MEPVIRTEGLTKLYGKTVGVADLDLEVQPGLVFGYLGPNGAGKTTTLRLLAGLLRPTAGRARVLGLDTVADVNRLHGRIGYLPGDFVGYPDLTGAQYLRYLGNLRGVVGTSSVVLLAKRLQIDLDRRIGTLSHGNRQKIGLIQAFMHQPDLLILDEPTAGLDPLMQQEFLTLVREVRDAGGTVLLSSHILDEVEAVADHVGIVRDGHLIDVAAVEDLKAQARRRLVLTFADEVPAAELAGLSDVHGVHVEGQTVSLAVEGSTARLLAVAAPYGIADVVSHEVDLEDIFMTYYTREA